MNFWDAWVDTVNTWVEGWSELMDEIYADWFNDSE